MEHMFTVLRATEFFWKGNWLYWLYCSVGSWIYPFVPVQRSSDVTQRAWPRQPVRALMFERHLQTLNHSGGNVKECDERLSFSSGFETRKAFIDDSSSGFQLLWFKKMMLNFLPVRKFKRNGRYIVFGVVLMVALLAAYLEFRATSEWSSSGEWHLMPCNTYWLLYTFIAVLC